jgi:hypothetical protein
MITEYLTKALDKQTENDVTIPLCYNLILNSIQFKTEVKLPKALVKGRGCRFDIVVYKDNTPVCIIEVKRLEGGKASVQAEYYTKVTGLPTIVCGGLSQIEETINSVLQLVRR